MPPHINPYDTSTSGRIYTFDMNNPNNGVTLLKIVGWKDFDDRKFNPHGLALWEEPNGDIFVYVINHPVDEDRVEVFKYGEGSKLHYLKSITDSNFTLTNNLVAVGKDKFYITNFLQNRAGVLNMLEMLSLTSTGTVAFYDGERAEIVARGLRIANGLALSKDKKLLYAVSGTQVWTFKILAKNQLELINELELSTAADNINLDSHGDLWLGAHPVVWKVMLHMRKPKEYKTPSQVVRVSVQDGVPTGEVSEVLSDDGGVLQCSTVAVVFSGGMLVGTIHHKLLYCHLD